MGDWFWALGTELIEVERFKLSYCLVVVMRVVAFCLNTMLSTSDEVAR